MSVDASGLIEAVRQFAEEVCAQGAERALSQIRPAVPIKDGTLRESEFNYTVGTHVQIGYSAEHASFTDEGTAAHPIPTPVAFTSDQGSFVIVPQGRGAFEAKDGTIVIMGRDAVNHPGTAAQRWWSDVVGDDGEGLEQILAEVAQSVVVVA